MVFSFERPLRCAITDLSSVLSESPAERRLRLGHQLRGWAVDGVDFVQLREKGLAAGELLELARTAMEVLREGTLQSAATRQPRLLLNGRPDIAVAAGTDGVHLSAEPGALTPAQTREIFAGAGRPAILVSISCHTLAEVSLARGRGADLILFGPIFEKNIRGEVVAEGKGLDLLREACLAGGPTPVLALGGVTAARVDPCLRVGAAGIAAIRLFAPELPTSLCSTTLTGCPESLGSAAQAKTPARA